MAMRKLHRFVSRAPRYVLRAQDKQVMRFALQETKGDGGIDSTILYNLSETGVAFLIDTKTHVKLGDIIKVEIPVPQGEQIAWWARVVRTEEYQPKSWFFSDDPFKDEAKTLVGCRFEELPAQHSLAIRKGIEESFIKAMREQKYRNWHYYRALFSQNAGRFLLYAVLTLASLYFIYYFSRPDTNYDAQRGAPWGQRFKF